MTPPNDALTPARKGRGRSQKSLALVDAAQAILAEIQPATVRAVCYQLFVQMLIASMSKNNTNRVGRLLVQAREEGAVPWEWIVDETRSVEKASTWQNPERIIEAAVQRYRRDNWADQPCRVEVWSEKGTVRGTLAAILMKYAVAFRVMHGYGSATALHDAAARSVDEDKPLHVIYVGDWDPSGLHMSEVDIPHRIERYGGRIMFQRVALLESDIDLPSFPVSDKAGDSRHRWFVENHGHRCWELDALSPPILRERVERAILDLIDIDAWNHALRIEQAEIKSMNTGLDAFKGILRQAPKCSQGAP
jgi:hypothetical protein